MNLSNFVKGPIIAVGIAAIASSAFAENNVVVNKPIMPPNKPAERHLIISIPSACKDVIKVGDQVNPYIAEIINNGYTNCTKKIYQEPSGDFSVRILARKENDPRTAVYDLPMNKQLTPENVRFLGYK